MGKPQAAALEMRERHKKLLLQLSRQHSTAQQIAKRARILLMASDGMSNAQIHRDLAVAYNTVLSWRKRWLSNYKSLLQFEKGPEGDGVSDKELRDRLLELLKDESRSGAPKVFTLSQRQQIVALACKKPGDFGIEMTDWTYEMLAKTAIAQGIVEHISGAWLGVILKKYRPLTS